MGIKFIGSMALIFTFPALFICSNSNGVNKVKEGYPDLMIRKTAYDTSFVGLELDHFFIWVEHPDAARKSLIQIGFNAIPDSLSAIHNGQGTAGKYFYFLNTYLELLYIYDEKEFTRNAELNDSLGFSIRADYTSSGASPFGIGLHMKNYDPSAIPFETIRYNQEWMGSTELYLLMAKSSFEIIKEPEIFVVYPKIQHRTITIPKLNQLPAKYADFFRHPNKARQMTRIIIETDLRDSAFSKAVETAKSIPILEIKRGGEHLVRMYFDNEEQEKSFDLRPELPLIVYL